MYKDSEVAGLRSSKPTGKIAEEAAHLTGSAILTAGVATVLVLVAVPISIGMGIAGALKFIRKRP